MTLHMDNVRTVEPALHIHELLNFVEDGIMEKTGSPECYS